MIFTKDKSTYTEGAYRVITSEKSILKENININETKEISCTKCNEVKEISCTKCNKILGSVNEKTYKFAKYAIVAIYILNDKTFETIEFDIRAKETDEF